MASTNPQRRNALSIRLFLFLLLGIGLAGCQNPSSTRQSDLPTAEEGQQTIVIALRGNVSPGDMVRIALYRKPEHWLKPASIFKGRLALVQQEGSTVTLYGVPKGQYALAAFIDRNRDGKLNRWLWLLPKEPVAFSKVPKFRRPPSFEEARFSVPESQSITLHF